VDLKNLSARQRHQTRLASLTARRSTDRQQKPLERETIRLSPAIEIIQRLKTLEIPSGNQGEREEAIPYWRRQS